MPYPIHKPLRLLVLPAFLLLAAGCDNPVEGEDDEHLEDIESIEITDLAGGLIAEMHGDHWHVDGGGAGLHLHPGDELEVRIYFVAPDGDRFQLPPDGAEHTLRVQIENPAIVAYEGHDDHGHFAALAAGETSAKIQVYHGTYPNGHPDWDLAAPLPIEVVDHGEH